MPNIIATRAHILRPSIKLNPQTAALSHRLSLVAPVSFCSPRYKGYLRIDNLIMAGMDSSPVEPAKTHAALVGRGGVGNYQEAKKWEGVPLTEPPVKIDPIVPPQNPLTSTPFTSLPPLLSSMFCDFCLSCFVGVGLTLEYRTQKHSIQRAAAAQATSNKVPTRPRQNVLVARRLPPKTWNGLVLGAVAQGTLKLQKYCNERRMTRRPGMRHL